MGNSVFILGAGASVHANAPVMRDFLDVAAIVGRAGPGTTDRNAFEVVSRARSELQLVHSKARFDLRNLESVFAAFEMAELFGRLGNITTADVTSLTKSMRHVIVRTLETSMRFQVVNGAVQPSSQYEHFARSLYEAANRGEHVSVVTFNYDIAIDFALATHFKTVDYCLLAQPRFGDYPIELMKLHGSLNWGVCSDPKCQGVGFVEIANYIDQLESPPFRSQLDGKSEVLLEVSRLLPTIEHSNCRTNYQADPVVVPPTTNKVGYHKQLEPVWRRAAERLAEADSIYVIGYSWPSGDQFFHHLFAIGSAGPQLLKKFAVINPEHDVRERFRNQLLGQQAAERFDVIEEGGGRFNFDTINAIRSRYGLSPNSQYVSRSRKSI